VRARPLVAQPTQSLGSQCRRARRLPPEQNAAGGGTIATVYRQTTCLKALSVPRYNLHKYVLFLLFYHHL